MPIQNTASNPKSDDYANWSAKDQKSQKEADYRIAAKFDWQRGIRNECNSECVATNSKYGRRNRSRIAKETGARLCNAYHRAEQCRRGTGDKKKWQTQIRESAYENCYTHRETNDY